MYPIEEILNPDPQTLLCTKFCPQCGGVTYPPGFFCIKCGRAQR